jgi:hypothetical protein
MKFKELEPVVLKKDHPKAGLRVGDLGTVVAVYERTKGLEVEFFRASGKTRAVVTLSARDVRRAQDSEIVAVRSAGHSA